MKIASIFFAKPTDFRKWLKQNHKKESELWVGYYKKATGLPSLTWSESVDQALCYGWIDGKRVSIDDKSYVIRFTPRKPNSNWSDVNIKKLRGLKKVGLMLPSGLAAFDKKKVDESIKYSYEREKLKLTDEYLQKIKGNKKAWQFFEKLPPSYKKQTTHWLMSAKKEETKLSRLKILIESSAKGEKIPPLQWGDKK